MYRTNNDDYLPESLVKIEYKIDHPNQTIKDRVSNSFKYYDMPPMGIGPAGNLFTGLDDYIDLSCIDEVRNEIEENIEFATQDLVYMTPFGLIPEHINNEKCLDSFLLNPEKYNIVDDAYTYAKDIKNYHELKRYYISKFNLTKSWKRILHFRNPPPFYNKGQPTSWKENIKHFPKTKKLIESLPFKHIGIALLFRSKEDNRLLIHRDSYIRNHSSHHINISISKKNRKVFIFDPIDNKRIYLDPKFRAYTFNECDLHGADPQFDHIVLRVDGCFTDEFAKSIGLENGVTFDWSYDKPQEFVKANGKIKVYNGTDL